MEQHFLFPEMLEKGRKILFAFKGSAMQPQPQQVIHAVRKALSAKSKVLSEPWLYDDFDQVAEAAKYATCGIELVDTPA